MRRRAKAVPIPEGNRLKYFSYRAAWGGISNAQGHGFYLEAVTLEESIIVDRLISFLVREGAIEADKGLEKHSFGQLIQRWRELLRTRYRPGTFLICASRSMIGARGEIK